MQWQKYFQTGIDTPEVSTRQQYISEYIWKLTFLEDLTKFWQTNNAQAWVHQWELDAQVNFEMV